MTPPTMTTDYRARCCGTCKHGKAYDLHQCRCDMEGNNIYTVSPFSICANHYELKEY